VEPISVLVTSALFVGAELARKPTNDFADLVWGRVKRALLKALGREPVAEDVTAPALEKVVATVPELRADLEAVVAHFSALRRARAVPQALRRARVLWIDDRPENNTWERSLLDAFGVSYLSVETTRSATALLQSQSFDVIISDIDRGERAKAGIEAIPAIRAVVPWTPIVFYVGALSSPLPPPGAQGIADEPNELLHLILDQLERHRL
jgi:CheY-like chemotaxis protein